MSLASAFAPAEAYYKEKILQETWGHLSPEIGHTYNGWIVFTLGCFNDITVIDFELGNLPSSPWFFQDIHDFIGEQIDKKNVSAGQVWRWDGNLKVLKNGKSRWAGKTRPCRVNVRFGKGPSL